MCGLPSKTWTQIEPRGKRPMPWKSRIFTTSKKEGGEAASEDQATHMQDGLWHRTEGSRRRGVGRTRPDDDRWQPRNASINDSFSYEKKKKWKTEWPPRRQGLCFRRRAPYVGPGRWDANRSMLKRHGQCLLRTIRQESTIERYQSR